MLFQIEKSTFGVLSPLFSISISSVLNYNLKIQFKYINHSLNSQKNV